MNGPQSPHEVVVLGAVAEAIESLAFEEVLLTGVLRDFPPLPESVVWSSIRVDDPPLGEFRLMLPLELLQRFTEAVYSQPAEELGLQVVLDDLGELMNTLTGRIIAGALPEDRVFQIGLPKTGSGRMDPLSSSSRLVTFQVGNETFFLALPESYWTDPEISRRLERKSP